MNPHPVLIICMGVCGSGKSSLAIELAETLALSFLEADDFHSVQNKTFMATGRALTEAMRAPWIDSLCSTLTNEHQQGQGCVLAYSGLKRDHRQRFRQLGFRTLFLYLKGDKHLIAGRLQKRSDHFAASGLLDSQFAEMQAPDQEADVVTVSIDKQLPGVIANALQTTRRFLQQEKTID